MDRRARLLILAIVLVLANSLGIGLPATALADTSYTTCPTFDQFQSDVQAISGTATITFAVPNCTIQATSTTTTPEGSTVTIQGNGLTLTGGTADDPASFDIFAIGGSSTLTLDQVTVEYGQNGVRCDPDTCGGNHLRLIDSTVRGNAANGVSIQILDAFNSTIRDNGSNGVFSDQANIVNSTIVNNTANGVRLLIFDGRSAAILFSTIAGSQFGISFVIQPDAHSSLLVGNILADNQTSCFVAVADSALLIDGGGNHATDDSCRFDAGSSRENVALTDLHLGTLGDHGGPTETIPLLSGSSALDALPAGSVDSQLVCLDDNGAAILNPLTGQPILADQRGISRPQGLGGCDAGAFEAEVEALPTTTTPSDASADDTATSVPLTATVTASSNVDLGTITFSVTDAAGDAVGDPVTAPVTNGLATATFVLSTALAPGSYIITAAYHDANGIFGDSQDIATLTITPGPPASITLSPGNTTAVVGSRVREIATVRDAAGFPVADGTLVTFALSGVNTATGFAPTSNGMASVEYRGDWPGTDTLTVTSGPATPATAQITWTAPPSTPWAILRLVNTSGPGTAGFVATGFGSSPVGLFVYADDAVQLSHVQLSSLVVSGSQATLYGQAQLATGETVGFRLEVTADGLHGQLRLRLSTGYDSGDHPAQLAWISDWSRIIGRLVGAVRR